MIRITGGCFRGHQIYCSKGREIRPTTAFVRESLFSILGSRILEARLLDLFAGCAIVGIEALSRGASFVEFVDNAPEHCRIIEKNVKHLKLPPDRFKISCQDVFAWIKREHLQGQFDIIFMDPPYGLEGAETVVEACFERQLLSKGGILVWESRLKNPPVPKEAELIDIRKYGSSTLSFYAAREVAKK